MQVKRPVTIILAKGTNGQPVIAKTLFYTCCTGAGFISCGIVKELGLCIEDTGTRGGTYTLVGGTFKSQGRVKVPSVMLPALSGDRTVDIELEVVPTR